MASSSAPPAAVGRSGLGKLWRRARSGLGCQNVQSAVAKLMFMMGFLVNCLVLTLLFVWLNLGWTELAKRPVRFCLGDLNGAYEYSLHAACAYFSLLSLLVMALILFMQLKQFGLEDQMYFVIALLGTSTFVFSAVLVLGASLGILLEADSCPSARGDPAGELKLRFVFQSTAAFLTSLLYMCVGISLSSRSQAGVQPIPPPTPVYQIHPPNFDDLYPPPPPTYQQSQRDHRRNQRTRDATED